MADAVMSGGLGPATRVAGSVPRMDQRACACGGACDECQEKAAFMEGAANSYANRMPAAPPIVHEVLRSPGEALDGRTRKSMETRFNRDFSRVRVHVGADAVASAQAISARAYTVGDHIVFGPNQYAPASIAGALLLAHELTHVRQQSQHGDVLRRKCLAEVGPTPPGCNLVSASATDKPTGERFLFNVNCDDFAPGEKARLAKFADPKVTPPESEITILGMASAEGAKEFNDSLSCHRAMAAVDVLATKGLGGNIRSVQATGGVPNTEHDSRFRAVEVGVKAKPAPTPPPPECPNQGSIAQDKDDLPAVPAYSPQVVPGKDLPAKLQALVDQRSKNFPAPPPPSSVLGFTEPLLPVIYPSVTVPSVRVEAQPVPGSDCKKCVADWALQRPEVVSFVSQGFIVAGFRFWVNQNQDPRQCPSFGTFGDKKDVRVLITPEAQQKIAQGEQEHFLDAQRSFDLTGGRLLANAQRLRPDRTPLRGADQRDCESKVAHFLESLAGSPGVLPAVGVDSFLKDSYTAMYVGDFLREFDASRVARDLSGNHTAHSNPPLNKPIQPNLDTAINPFGCNAFFVRDDKDSFPGIPGANSTQVIVDQGEPPKEPWHEL